MSKEGTQFPKPSEWAVSARKDATRLRRVATRKEADVPKIMTGHVTERLIGDDNGIFFGVQLAMMHTARHPEVSLEEVSMQAQADIQERLEWELMTPEVPSADRAVIADSYAYMALADMRTGEGVMAAWGVWKNLKTWFIDQKEKRSDLHEAVQIYREFTAVNKIR
jgi:hypothetical protein